MWIIVGLGNPGEDYARTRHNIGFMALKRLAERHGLAFDTKRAHARIAEGTIAGQRVALAKPLTYMNLSGQAVSGLRSWYKVDPATAILVIYDDLDLPFGKLRLREKGSAGTHNGMKSIVAQLGSPNFPRLRVGIGQPAPDRDTVGYVLGRFSPAEEAALPGLLDQVADAAELVIREGPITAMNRFNAGGG